MSMMVGGCGLCTKMRRAHGGKHRHERRRKKKKKQERTRGGAKRSKVEKEKRKVAQQVVHTARWVPGAW